MKEILEKLGLNGFDILFHALNLAILIVALYFLLYKPVKKMIAGHRQKLDALYHENERLQQQADEVKNACEDMKQKAIEESAAAGERALQRGNEIVEEARKQADAILENAQKEAAAERQRMQNELHDTVGHVAVEIAGKILAREVSEEDNRRLIDESLSEWEQ